MNKNKKTIEQILSETEFVKPEDIPSYKEDKNTKNQNCDATDLNHNDHYGYDDSDEDDVEISQVSFIMDQIIHFTRCTKKTVKDKIEIIEIHMMDSPHRLAKPVSHLFTIETDLRKRNQECFGAKVKSNSNIGNLIMGFIDLHLPKMCLSCQSILWEQGYTWKQVIDLEMKSKE